MFGLEVLHICEALAHRLLCVCACVCVCVCVCVCTYVHVYMHTYYTHMHMHTLTLTHTHTHLCPPVKCCYFTHVTEDRDLGSLARNTLATHQRTHSIENTF
jgi:hypothetical protein